MMKSVNNKKSKGNQNINQLPIVKNKALRWVLIACGTIFVGLGLIGIVLPILPTTPFLLLAAWCYARSSERYYKWLISNKRFGKYIKDYREGKGIPLKAKITAITLLWFTISLSIIFIVFNLYIRIIMLITAILVSIYITSIKPKTRK
jgi:uncharacterized membrane protein YbaN (DUF454 family)